MFCLNFAQKTFIRHSYAQVNGCYVTLAKEFSAKFNRACPGISTVNKIVGGIKVEDESDDEQVIKDVFLPQSLASPRRAAPHSPKTRHDSLGHLSSAFSFEDDRSSSVALQNLRNAAHKSSSNCPYR